MNFDKGRPKPIPWNAEIPEDSLESRLTTLAEMKTELRDRTKAYKDQTKHLRESIKAMENIVTDEVLKLGKTVTVGNIRVEYIPTVKIKLKKEQNDGE